MMSSIGSGWPQQAFKIRRQTINLCIFLSLSLQSFLLDILSSHFQLTFLSDCYFSFILLQFFFFHFSLQSSKKTPITVSFISAFPSWPVSRMTFQLLNLTWSFSCSKPLTRKDSHTFSYSRSYFRVRSKQ